MSNKRITKVALLLAAAGLCRAPAQDKIATDSKSYSLFVQDKSVLQTILQWGENNRLAMGIEILDPRLCEKQISLHLSNVPAPELLNAALKGTRYSWSAKDGVFEVKPRDTRHNVNAKLLTLTVAHFKSLPMTIQGVGLQLKAMIGSTISHGNGYALDVLSSIEAETIPSFTVHQKSVEYILNAVVSKGSKGVWILYESTAKQRDLTIGDPENLNVLGYKDDRYL